MIDYTAIPLGAPTEPLDAYAALCRRCPDARQRYAALVDALPPWRRPIERALHAWLWTWRQG